MATIAYGNDSYKKYVCIAYSYNSEKVELRFAQANKGLLMPLIEVNELKAIIRLKDPDNRNANNIQLIYSGTKKDKNRLFETYFIKESSGTTATLYIPQKDGKMEKNVDDAYIMMLEINGDNLLGYNCIENDISLSFEQYLNSCKNGNSNDCYTLALAYEKGSLGIKKKNEKEALYYYEKSCNYGNVNGCSNAGIIHYNQNNNNSASRFLQKGCDSGDRYSCVLLEKYGLIGLDMLNEIIEGAKLR